MMPNNDENAELGNSGEMDVHSGLASRSESDIEPAAGGSANVSPKTTTTSISTFRGPIPPPEILARYESVLPGTAERIISMAERQATHRQSLETTAEETVKAVIEGDSRKETLGMWLGAIVAVFLIACGTFAVYNGYDWAGTTMIVSTILGIVGAFVSETRKGRLERMRSLETIPRRREED